MIEVGCVRFSFGSGLVNCLLFPFERSVGIIIDLYSNVPCLRRFGLTAEPTTLVHWPLCRWSATFWGWETGEENGQDHSPDLS